MTKKQENINSTPEQLYLKMLEIGSECISCGTNLRKIKSELSRCGLISSNDDDTTLRIIFQNSFTHDETNKIYGSYCKAPEPEFECNPSNKEEYDKLQEAYNNCNHEYECTWFLTPEALMNLLHLRESQNNRTVSENMVETSKRSLNISYIAIGIAILSALVPLLYDKFYETNELKTLKVIESHIKNELNQEKIIKHLDTTIQIQIYKGLGTINYKIDSLSEVSSKERYERVIKPINNILKSYKSIDNKLNMYIE